MAKYNIPNLYIANRDRASEGGGGGSVSITRDALYSGATITAAGSYELAEDYEDYDIIEFVVGYSTDYSSNQCALPVMTAGLKAIMDSEKKYILTQYGESLIHFTISSSALVIDRVANLYIIGVNGYKFS